jgi:hypothetical protein
MLEILEGLSEHADAHAGRPVVAVFTVVVYVAQNASPELTTLLAHGSVLGFVQPRTRGTMALRARRDRIVDLVSASSKGLENDFRQTQDTERERD